MQLHLIHDLGGGASKWLADFLQADDTRENLVLKSITHDENAGGGLALYGARDTATPLRVWTFRKPIPAVADTHEEYSAALAEVLRGEQVGAVIISSLIGHSLDAMATGVPTVVVNHDYFPYCPAINLYFDAPCQSCDAERIEHCGVHNPRFSPFVGFTPAMRAAARERFVELSQRDQVTLVVPSDSVARNLRMLDARFARVRFLKIPHGYGRPLQRAPAPEPGERERLRIMVLGQMSTAKGADLLREALPRITLFADVEFAGTRELGETLEGMPHVSVVSRYEPEELPDIVARFNPHLGLLASIVPETFSYALSELFMLGVPVAATRLGSFVERIREGVDGWLFAPEPGALVALLRSIDANRSQLVAMRAALRSWSPRSARDMVADYHRALQPVAGRTSPAQPRKARASDDVVARQAITLAGLWRENKGLHLQLSVGREKHQREHRDLLARQQGVLRELDVARRRTQDVERVLEARERELAGLSHQVRAQEEQMRAIFSSRSWRVLGVFRRSVRAVRRARLLARCLAGMLRDPAPLRLNVRQVWSAWRNAGMLGMKTALLRYQFEDGVAPEWRAYRARLRSEVLPKLAEAAKTMKSRPRISVIMPTYNTDPAMLRSALDSVLGQVYGEWELCVSDDASSQPQVASIVREYAARDGRIKASWGTENRGVAHASNRALEMATGDYVVLMDHDDALEEQALLRFAQAIVADAPDLLYSDEVLTAADGERADRLVYRPAFSPALLRAHPYIVHLVGFRASLLREIGGFDESLRISQDYDLVLRASERATRIVHVPEVLYRWRTLPGSAGHKMMDQVMETSTSILQRHLDRASPGATASPGFGFNFFDVRYPLDPGLRVAIVIPTKNLGALVRQCVESIHATVSGIAFDVVVVDHQSDDPETVEYLRGGKGIDRLIRYEGSFNFSAINNFAVSQLDGDYSHYLFCNNDVEAIAPGWLARMLQLAQQQSVGIVGAKLLYGDRKTIQHAGVCVGGNRRAEHYGKFVRLPDEGVDPGYYGTYEVDREMSAVTAACMLIRRDAFEEVGGFDEMLEVGFGDVDLCLRVGQRGYRILQCPHATLVHHESMSRGLNNAHPADSALYEAKWHELLRSGDPYYNPGLSLTSTTWQAKSPLHCEAAIVRRVVSIDRARGRQSITFSAD
ncbi:MAG TPA: glycosyltransferase [Usitatibacter sp.]|nr:glycosyltransferase [Usitatibacter sp.]